MASRKGSTVLALTSHLHRAPEGQTLHLRPKSHSLRVLGRGRDTKEIETWAWPGKGRRRFVPVLHLLCTWRLHGPRTDWVRG